MEAVLRTPGEPLGDALRLAWEPRFDHDFSRVRVHTDTKGIDAAEVLNARAFAVGHHVGFAAGQWDPHTDTGSRLLAHELSHVVQQPSASSASPETIRISSPTEPAERLAEEVASGVRPAWKLPAEPTSELMLRRQHSSSHSPSVLTATASSWGSGAGATARAQEIDEQVRAHPEMPVAELQRLFQERDQVLPLTEHPPRVQATAPAPPGRPSPADLPGAVPITATTVLVPTPPSGPAAPPSVLFGTEAAADTVGATSAEAALEGAAGASKVPVAGWIVAGVIVIGVVGYRVYRHYQRSQRPELVEAPSGVPSTPAVAPPVSPPAPVSMPGADPGSPISMPGGQSSPGPVSLPGATTTVEPLLVSSIEVEEARRRLDELERSGSLFREVGNLWERLGAADDAVRKAAQAELRSLEQEVADYERIRRGEDITSHQVPFTPEAAFDELMNRYPPPLNEPPYNDWPREEYRIVRLQPKNLSEVRDEQKKILVIRAPNGHRLRFSVVWREDGTFGDIHHARGPSPRQR